MRELVVSPGSIRLCIGVGRIRLMGDPDPIVRVLLVGQRMLYLSALRDSLIHFGLCARLAAPCSESSGQGAVDTVVAEMSSTDNGVSRWVIDLLSIYPQASLAILHGGRDVAPMAPDGVLSARVGWIDLRRPLLEIASDLRSGLRVDRRRSSGSPDAGHYASGSGLSVLTRRELEILELLVGGCAHGVIAERLGISKQTVRTHTANMMGKLQVTSQVQLVGYAVRAGVRCLNPASARR